jgi:hypothetical protein
VLVIGLVAMFNYLTRIADGTGVEADYQNELPEFVYRGVTESVPRPGPDDWPPVDGSLELLSVLPDAFANWQHWRDYVLDSPEPIPTATRRRLRSIAARNACDGAAPPPDDAGPADAGPADAGPADAADETQAQFPDTMADGPAGCRRAALDRSGRPCRPARHRRGRLPIGGIPFADRVVRARQIRRLTPDPRTERRPVGNVAGRQPQPVRISAT